MKRTCATCRWRTGADGEYARCSAPQVRRMNEYTGFIGSDWDYCSIERSEGWIMSRMGGKCGRSGRWWERREEEQTSYEKFNKLAAGVASRGFATADERGEASRLFDDIFREENEQ